NLWFKGDVVSMGTVAEQSSSLPSILESAASKPVPCKRFGGTQIGRKGANGLNISAHNLAEYGAVSSSDECNRMESIMRVSHLAIPLGLTLMNTGELRAEDSILRDLSVEQATAFQAGTPAPGSLRISTWVDRHDLTYARGDDVRIFVKTNEDAYVTI